jgi:GPH family glycoside/pentoside/hexuronide:cation symporter
MAVKEDLSEWDVASTGKMISYAFGYIIINYLLSYGLANLFYYYEVELGLEVVLVGIAFVIFAIWNMINDPILGYLTEKKFKWINKWGLRAPWVVFTSIPVLVFYWLIWAPLLGTGATVLFIWFILLTCVFDTFFSIYNDHVYGGFTNQFPSEYERRKAFAIASVLLGIFIVGLSILGNLVIVYGKPETFITLATLIVIILFIFNLILFAGIRESRKMKDMFIRGFERAEKEKISFYKTVKVTLTSKNFVVSLIGYTISVTAIALWNASLIYVYKDIYHVPYAYGAIPSLVGVLFFIGAVPFWYNYSRKHGFKKTYWVCFVIHGLTFIPFLFITDIWVHTIFFILWEIFYSGEVVMLMPVASDTYDEVSAKLGKRTDATLVGIRNFFFRIAFLIQAVVLTVVHVMTLYNPSPYAIQTAEAIWGIRVHTALIPAIMFIIMGLIFRQFYTLEGAEKQELVKKLKDLGIYQ